MRTPVEEEILDGEGDLWRRHRGEREFTLAVVGTRMKRDEIAALYGEITNVTTPPRQHESENA